ncbi:2-amino-4-hydroxy-6-hydroxymethyldihydropteridine diphosphokinase [Sphingomonas sp.]|jgi:2-amino-4-hydroxy-6-hydroxymethyldihydropteridine diphosphokinase|uniref:2-amino-4-hydroxy-6- hydroxymethyldihydropteridine diphosphokinase n=1 Tax=Sphingomonas sp. TaxID=28214 RepID=UPI002D80DDC4|nr:2-amino-4-hydroxy-6-hydroxymethyldihydropteridine diphosphokinase [Sphingomonas sp.]HEU0043206.1 2-amino-4-hydroxy-6-hydroxymethyldihydropteridine diphosphokinase [Sphingomonas sp.]
MRFTSYAIALGSNRRGRHGPPEAEVRAAARALGARTLSRVMASAAIGPSVRRFANAVALVDSDLSPPAMLVLCKRIERDFGRRRGQRWGARVIDLDLVLWSGGAWRSVGLSVPHHAFRERRFVLGPLVQVAPGWRDPATALTVRQLHARLTRPRPLA